MRKNLFRLLSLGCGLLLSLSASAAALYDPEPPANSAYLRVIYLGTPANLQVWVDGKLRQAHLSSGEVGEYLVLPMGKHTLALQAAAQARPNVTSTLEVEGGHAVTVAFTGLQADAKPLIFEDKTSSNKLKALLAVYHLDAHSTALDVLTADGKTKVFSGLAHGMTRQLAVNPISVELIATAANSAPALAHVKVEMSAGASYSIFLLPNAAGKLSAQVVQNKVERYTGK